MTSLSPAEERGLRGLSLDSRVRQIFYSIPHATLRELTERMNEVALERSFTYMREGVVEPVRLFLRPTGVMPDQLAYLHFVTLTLINALKRLPDLYIQDFAVRAIVPLTPPEEKWLWDTWGPSQREANPVLGRLDATIDFTSAMWKDTLRFVEPNLSGVGGLHLIPTGEQMLADVVLPIMQQYAPDLHMEPGQDLREMFIQEIFDHLDAIGHRGKNLCFVEPKYADDGPVEQAALARYYHDRHDLTVLHADPAELHLKNGQVYYADQVVDMAYRDYEVRDLLDLEHDEGVNIGPLRALFKQNRIMSSMVGEFDHKSCWEILTDPNFTQKYFNAEERQVFRRHVLWTRVLSERRTTLSNGETVDLLDYARKERDQLVIKPNRSYGGDRVLIGPAVTQGEWEAAIEQAVSGDEHGDERVTDTYVVQRLANLPVSEFPLISPEGEVSIEPFYTVMGLAPTKYGVAILGRASQKMVVNVAQRGGLCGVLVGKLGK